MLSRTDKYSFKLAQIIIAPVLILINLFMMRQFNIKFLLLMIRFYDVEISRWSNESRACRIIYYKELRCSTILMEEKLSRIEFNTGLLHELGHHMDYKNNPKMKKHSNKRIEKSAWKNAIELSDKYSIPICYTTAKQWLKTYGANSAFINKGLNDDR